MGSADRNVAVRTSLIFPALGLQRPGRVALGLCFALATAACADAPITAADLQSNGELRQGTQNVLSAAETAGTQRASHGHVTGVLAAQAEGPLEDEIGRAHV